MRRKKRQGLDTVRWEGQSGKATLYIGLKKGHEPQNQRGACAKLPAKAKVAEVEGALKKVRAKQIGVRKVGMTRYHASGTYKGRPEPSAIYELIDTGDDQSWSGFRQHVSQIAKKLAQRLCQDEVIVTFETPAGDQRTCAYGWGAGAGSTRSDYCEPGGLSGHFLRGLSLRGKRGRRR